MGQIRSHHDIRQELQSLLSRDVRLVPVAEQVPEVPLRLSQPGFRGLANIIVSQQVSKASAAAISARLEKLVDPFTPQSLPQSRRGRLDRSWPLPAQTSNLFGAV